MSAGIIARLSDRAVIDTFANGDFVARFDSYSVGLGVFGARVVDWLPKLRAGVPLSSLKPESQKSNKEIDLLVRRLAELRLLEFRLDRPRHGGAFMVIEPQVRGYWPQIPALQNTDMLVVSRFVYLRRHGNEMVLESPCADALFRIRDPALASFIASLSTPRRVAQLRKEDSFPGLLALALLVDCRVVEKVHDAGKSESTSRAGDTSLALWEFHDLLFHARSTGGRHASAVGAAYPHVGTISPLPAVRPNWAGKKIDLRDFSAAAPAKISPLAQLLRERRSVRAFDDSQPMTLAELAQFLDCTARVLSRSVSHADFDDGGSTVRPYPSAGASYEFELYVTVRLCQGVPRGFYHYDAGADALVPISVSSNDIEATLSEASYAMGTDAPPPVLITIAARFGRVAWKYSSIAYALILKDAGVLTQTFYLAATEMGLGGCALGIVNIDLFAKMTGIDFYEEGPVGQFALGRPKKSGSAD